MDWDKLRIFQAAADAGSFTHAGETLGLSQSAVSRQVGALETDIGAPLFHRHARGLILTEQGEMLLGVVRDVVLKLDAVRSRLIDSREKPNGDLKVTTTLGLGANWLAPRLGEFVELYPEVKLQLLLSDEDLDLAMREADVALAAARADAAGPHPSSAVHRAFPRLRVGRLSEAAPAATQGRGSGPPSSRGLRRADRDPSPLRPQFAAGARPRSQKSADPADLGQQSRRDGAGGGERGRHRRPARLCGDARIRGSCACCRRPTCRKWIAFSSMRRN